nr:reverse transcriptase domain-containing protein [Tanacetum cinerariifolium]
MDKIRCEKRKEVHAKLDFEENPRKSQRVREGSQNSSAETLPARYRNPSERPKMRDRLKYNDEDVFDRLGRTRETREIALIIEDVLVDEALLEETVLETETSLVALKNHMRSNFQNQAKDGRGSNKFTPLTRTPKEIFTAESGKFKPPPPMVTPVEKRSSNKFYEFHNDKGHNTDECVQLWKQIEELVRAGKLSCFIKEIRQERDQQNTRKKDASVKDKAAAIYMIRPPGIREIQAVPSTTHGMLKFPMNGGIVTIRNHEITIGGMILTKAQMKLRTLLKGNLDIFTWKPSNMTGLPRSIVEHRLNIREGYSLVRQKKGQTSKRAKAIQVEDCYPIPEIHWKVESLCGYPFKCFLDAYKGYHQIQMAEQDEEKTVFHTSHEVYCNTKIPFGLKNAGATYQRLVDNAFDRKIGRNLEIYVDDLVIKSHTETELPWDIEETFRAGLILKSPDGMKFTYALRFQFTASNNEAEYEALIAGLQIATQIEDAREMIRKCKDFLIHRLVPRHPQQPLTPITAPWPFYNWRIDIAGPFSKGSGKVKFLIIAMDYFTKWIEAKVVATITGSQVKKFVWDNIVCRFGLPGEIVSNNDGGKLGPKWEGPYEVMEALGDGAYKLRSTDRTVLSRTWNITYLKKCYL